MNKPISQEGTTHKSLDDFNEEYVRFHYRLLRHSEYGITEIRTFDGTPEVAYTDNEEDFVRVVKEKAGRTNVYVGCNPRPLELWDVAPNRWCPAKKGSCASDEQIEYVTTAFFDLDPVRPKGEAATDEEHVLAVNEVGRIQNICGYPDGITASSGNGAYLLFSIRAITVEKDTASQYRSWYKNFLAENNSHASTLKWDPVFNLSRVMRIIGTKNMKGTHTDERPHRHLAKILNRRSRLPQKSRHPSQHQWSS
jgi:hypothetical protein